MLLIVPCSHADGAVLAALWNAKRLDVASCWHNTPAITPVYVESLLTAGTVIVLASEDDEPVGFGMWCGPVSVPRMVALAADDEHVYYRLLAAYCQWGLAQDAETGYTELSTAATTERGWMDALAVIEYTPIGFERLVPGQPAESRVPKLLRAQCDLQVLADAVNAMLEALA